MGAETEAYFQDFDKSFYKKREWNTWEDSVSPREYYLQGQSQILQIKNLLTCRYEMNFWWTNGKIYRIISYLSVDQSFLDSMGLLEEESTSFSKFAPCFSADNKYQARVHFLFASTNVPNIGDRMILRTQHKAGVTLNNVLEVFNKLNSY